MSRLILTFPTLFKVLAADKLLSGKFLFRPTPTPAGLSADVCGMSIELLDTRQRERVIETLSAADLKPQGVHVLG